MRASASPTRIICSGIASGSGLAGSAHSSVHDERSWRAGLPVFARERSVSADVAARNFSLTTGCVSASSVVSHTEPHHTPWAPSASAAATWRPSAMPPAASTGVGATASTTCGHQDHRADLPGVPTGLGALGDDQVDAGGLLALGVDDGPDEAGDQDAAVVGLGDEVVRAPDRGRWRRA